MPEKDYSATKLVVFTQQCASGLNDKFKDFYTELVKYAEKNGFEKPKKQELVNDILTRALENFTPEEFYNG